MMVLESAPICKAILMNMRLEITNQDLLLQGGPVIHCLLQHLSSKGDDFMSPPYQRRGLPPILLPRPITVLRLTFIDQRLVKKNIDYS